MTTHTLQPGGTLAPYLTVALSFFIVVLDGLDTTAIAFVAPAMAKEWGLAPSQFTAAFVSTSIGAVLGYMSSGYMSRCFGLRRAAQISVLVFALGTLATAFVTRLEVLVALRLVTAIGLGSVLPIMVSAATSVVSPRWREMTAMLVVTGLSAGSMLGGMLGMPLIRSYGWPSIFWVGGILPLLVLPWLSRVLTAQAGASSGDAGRQQGKVADLFRRGLGVSTTLLWLFALLIFINAYALMFWTPTLLMDFGFRPEQAPLGTAAFGMGGLIGNLIMIALVAKAGVRPLLFAATGIAMACVLVISKSDLASGSVLWWLGGAGGGLIAGCVGQTVLAVALYPADLRINGVGWAAASGRVGSIVGPALGGIMLTWGWGARDIVLTALAPAVLALLVLALIRRPKTI